MKDTKEQRKAGNKRVFDAVDEASREVDNVNTNVRYYPLIVGVVIANGILKNNRYGLQVLSIDTEIIRSDYNSFDEFKKIESVFKTKPEALTASGQADISGHTKFKKIWQANTKTKNQIKCLLRKKLFKTFETKKDDLKIEIYKAGRKFAHYCEDNNFDDKNRMNSRELKKSDEFFKYSESNQYLDYDARFLTFKNGYNSVWRTH